MAQEERVILGLLAAVLLMGTANAASTIDTTQPTQGAPYASAPIRNNFAAAAADTNLLTKQFAGTATPVSPVAGQPWIDQTVSPWNVKIYDGTQFVIWATLNPTAHTFGISQPITSGNVTAALGYTPLNPANNLSDVASALTSRANLGLGTAAIQASTFFLQTANNLSDLNNIVTARTNLGLGSAALQPVTAFLQSANNLSDVPVPATARSNLGLGTAAVQNTGTSGNAIPLLNGINTWIGQQTMAAGLTVQPSAVGNGIESVIDSTGLHQAQISVGAGSATIKTTTADNLLLSANNVLIATLTSGGGVQIGVPTGGDKGVGTLNLNGGLFFNGVAKQQVPNVQVFTSGSALTYTTPTGAVYLRVRMAGGGGGGQGSGTTPGAGTAGGNSTFGTALLTANGGAAGSTGTGGTVTGCLINQTGGAGQGGTTATNQFGGLGGGNSLGQGGMGGLPGAAGASAVANTGGGGGGAGDGATVNAGGGGGAGGTCEAFIGTPAATYTYTVGAAGAGGAAGTSGFAGGGGAAGIIIVEAYF